MKKIALILLMLINNSVVYAEEKNEQVPSSQSGALGVGSNLNNLIIQTRPEIVGLWGMRMQVDKKSKCTEYYNFKGGDELIIQSGKELSRGIYDYQPLMGLDMKAARLIFQIQYENNEVDCSGEKQDQTGDVIQYFVKFKDAHTLELCNIENPVECFATLHKVRP